jgi:hypothetical protein
MGSGFINQTVEDIWFPKDPNKKSLGDWAQDAISKKTGRALLSNPLSASDLKTPGYDYDPTLASPRGTNTPPDPNLDLSTPNLAETGSANVYDKAMALPNNAGGYWDSTKGYWVNSTAGQQYVGSQLPGMTAPGAGQTYQADTASMFGSHAGGGNAINQVLSGFEKPDIANDPGLAAYYDLAKKRALASIDQNSATRGTYGSSAALGQGADAMATLEAQKAKEEAAYNLNRLAEQRQWEQLHGSLAKSAEESALGWATEGGNLAMSAEDLARGKQKDAIDAALGMDEGEFNRAMGGISAAKAADAGALGGLDLALEAAGQAGSARNARVGTLWNAQTGNTSAAMGGLGDLMNKALSGELDLTDESVKADLAASLYAAGMSQQDIDNFLNFAATAGKAYGGLA